MRSVALGGYLGKLPAEILRLLQLFAGGIAFAGQFDELLLEPADFGEVQFFSCLQDSLRPAIAFPGAVQGVLLFIGW